MVEYQTEQKTCCWCYERSNTPATMRVWSHSWQAWMDVCEKHADAIERGDAQEEQERLAKA